MAGVLKGPEVLAGAALVGAVLFANMAYKMPGQGRLSAREKTGYVPEYVKRPDEHKQLVESKASIMKRRSSSSPSDPSGFSYKSNNTQSGEPAHMSQQDASSMQSHQW